VMILMLCLSGCNPSKKSPPARPPSPPDSASAVREQFRTDTGPISIKKVAEEHNKGIEGGPAVRLTDDFGLPLVIVIEVPEVPPELLGPSPPIPPEKAGP